MVITIMILPEGECWGRGGGGQDVITIDSLEHFISPSWKSIVPAEQETTPCGPLPLECDQGTRSTDSQNRIQHSADKNDHAHTK